MRSTSFVIPLIFTSFFLRACIPTSSIAADVRYVPNVPTEIAPLPAPSREEAAHNEPFPDASAVSNSYMRSVPYTYADE